MNRQREVVYHRRRELLSGAPLKDDIADMCDALIEEIVKAHVEDDAAPEEWNWKAIEDAFYKQFHFHFNFREHANGHAIDHPDDLIDVAGERVRALYEQREQEFTPPVMRQIEKIVMLQTLDSLWKDHLLAMDHLKESIGLRGYAQLNPLVEYQKEGFSMFESLMGTMQADVVEKVFSVQTVREQSVQQLEQQQRPQRVMMSHGGQTEQATAGAPPGAAAGAAGGTRREAEKVGRNDPCPCGSGKKYKRCHGK